MENGRTAMLEVDTNEEVPKHPSRPPRRVETMTVATTGT